MFKVSVLECIRLKDCFCSSRERQALVCCWRHQIVSSAAGIRDKDKLSPCTQVSVSSTLIKHPPAAIALYGAQIVGLRGRQDNSTLS